MGREPRKGAAPSIEFEDVVFAYDAKAPRPILQNLNLVLEPGATTALALAGDEAVVVEASWHGSTVVPLPLGGPFHARRLTLKSSQVGNLPPAKRPRWDYTRRMNLALKLAGDASLDVLFERDAVAFEDLPAALPSICGARAGAVGLCHRVVYS